MRILGSLVFVCLFTFSVPSFAKVKRTCHNGKCKTGTLATYAKKGAFKGYASVAFSPKTKSF